MKNTLLDRLPDGSAPSTIFDVLEFVESKLDADHLTAVPHVGILHDTRKVRDMPETGKFEFKTDRCSRSQPGRSPDQHDTASPLAEVLQQTPEIVVGRQRGVGSVVLLRRHQQDRLIRGYAEMFPEMHFFHGLWIGHEQQRDRRGEQIAYFAAVSYELALVEVADGARCTSGNLLIMAELQRPFADEPRVVLSSKKRRAIHDLLPVKRERNFQRQSYRQERCRRRNGHHDVVHIHRSRTIRRHQPTLMPPIGTP